MSERDEKRGGAGCFVMGVIGFFVPVLYVLGIGPSAWLVKHYPVNGLTILRIYFPLILLGDNCPPIQTVLKWYVGLWT